MSELRPCRDCGTIIESPATVCSDRCYSEVYGETRIDYEDERHPETWIGRDDDETESSDDDTSPDGLESEEV